MSNLNNLYATTEPELNKKAELPLVWLLPIIAILVSGWLIYKSASEKGPTITISFPTAEGLEIDKTKIKYLDVEIGKVTNISINEDLKTILVTAQMNHGATSFLNEHTSFWVVRPQVGLAGVSGLGTLLSGPYIEIHPGDGHEKRSFVGLKTAPVLKTNAEGKQFILETNNLGSMRPGTPINFHGINVGEVLSHKLSPEANAILLTVFINAPYDQFVRKNTRFWVDSGIDLSAGADGFKVRTGPLISILSGGIAFRASAQDSVSDIETENSVFKLYDTYDQSTQIVYNTTLKYVMYFNGSVRGLTIDAPVQLRGITIGKVVDINLEIDEKTAEIHIPVIVEVEPERIRKINNLDHVSDKDVLNRLINKGLRAQLQTGSLITGQLLVDLDFYPNSKIIVSNHPNQFPEFPTMASSFDQFTHSANIIMDKIAKLPLDETSKEINKTLKSLQQTSTVASETLHTAKGGLKTLDNTLLSTQQVLGNFAAGSSTQYQIEQLLIELTQTANSLKQLSDYLEQHPDSLIKGKKEP
ncbi:MAG: MlaD family protein [Methylococcaceae bacterium]|jgi:paraquat-inducible protein B